jgi:sigma-B regulation protein RsbU (phosphoserine phosphatase)
MESYLSEDSSADTALGPAHSIAEFKIRSVMCVPLASSEGKPLGALQLDTQDRSKKFREDDLKLLTIVANLAAVAIEKARLHENALAREREQQEIELAKQVQLGFLPQTVPVLAGYEFFSHYSAAKTVGGDYYDFIQLPAGKIAITLGDVAGKGVPAALLTAKLSSEVRFCLLTKPNVADAMMSLNEALMRGGLGDRFVTMLLAVVDPLVNTLTVVNAGHMNPKLFHGGRDELTEAISNDATGLPLGVMAGYPYEEVTLTLEPWDTILVYTDGVTDAMNPAGEFFGNDGLDKLFAADDSVMSEILRPIRLGERLVTAVKKHAAGTPQNDDIAVVAFGRLDPAHGPVTNSRIQDTGSIKMPVRESK